MSISKADDELREAYEAELAQKHKDMIEEMAYVIYERGFRYLRLDVPEWVPLGNSLAQDEARATAVAVLKIVKGI